MLDNIRKTAAETGFDIAAWREEMLALNPWARGLDIAGATTEFVEARQKATLARCADGRAWNAWAKDMLAFRLKLESANQWAAEPERWFLPKETKSAREWLSLARAEFSSFRFGSDVSFNGFIFVSDARFVGATFSSHTAFLETTFSGNADFSGATFSDGISFGAKFLGDADFRGVVTTHPSAAL